MTESTDTQSSIDEQARTGWSAASDLMHPFGAVASNFTETIRALSGAHERGEAALNPGAANHIIRLLKNNTLKATYYFFSKEFRPSALNKKSHITERELLEAYAPMEHAAIISLCYLFKTLSRKIDKEEWDYVQTPLYESICIGACVGESIQEVGLGIGLLQRGIRYLAFAPLLRENRRAFKEYRRHLKTIDKAFDSAFEQNMWQCSTTQIAAILLERLGFPRSFSLQFISATDRDESVEPDPIFGVPLRIAESLIHCYIEGEEIPTSLPPWVGKELGLSAEVRGNLLASLNKTVANKNRIEWLNKGSSSISPDLTPELFSEAEKEAFAQAANEATPKPS